MTGSTVPVRDGYGTTKRGVARRAHVPLAVPVLGLIGAPLHITAVVLTMFGVIDRIGPVAAIAALPIAAWELSLGIYLVVKGFKPCPITDVMLEDATRPPTATSSPNRRKRGRPHQGPGRCPRRPTGPPAWATSPGDRSAAKAVIVRETVASEATRPYRPGSLRSSAISARQSPPRANVTARSTTTLAGSWTANGLRQPDSATDITGPKPAAAIVSVNRTPPAWPTAPEFVVSTWRRG